MNKENLERLESLRVKLENHIITKEEYNELHSLVTDLAIQKYITNLINDENIPFEKRIKNVYQLIQYCSGLDVEFPDEYGNDRNFYFSPIWKRISKSIRKRDNFTCRICNISGKRLNIHHIIPKLMGGDESDSNLITLCIDCHRLMPKSQDTRFKIEELKMEQNRQSLTKRQLDFIEIYKKKMGLISTTCESANVSRAMYYRWLEKPAFRLAIEEATTSIKDFGEASLYKSINKGDVASIIFFNKTKNRDRGYIEKPEVQVIGHQTNTQVNIDTNIHELIENARNKQWKSQNQTSDL